MKKEDLIRKLIAVYAKKGITKTWYDLAGYTVKDLKWYIKRNS